MFSTTNIIVNFCSGGAVAIDIASSQEYKNKILALIIENTFTSIPDMAQLILRWRLLHWLPNFIHKNKVSFSFNFIYVFIYVAKQKTQEFWW